MNNKRELSNETLSDVCNDTKKVNNNSSQPNISISNPIEQVAISSHTQITQTSTQIQIPPIQEQVTVQEQQPDFQTDQTTIHDHVVSSKSVDSDVDNELINREIDRLETRLIRVNQRVKFFKIRIMNFNKIITALGKQKHQLHTQYKTVLSVISKSKNPNNELTNNLLKFTNQIEYIDKNIKQYKDKIIKNQNLINSTYIGFYHYSHC